MREVSNGEEGTDSSWASLLCLQERSGTLKKLSGSSLQTEGMERSKVFTQHEFKLESSLLCDVVLQFCVFQGKMMKRGI